MPRGGTVVLNTNFSGNTYCYDLRTKGLEVKAPLKRFVTVSLAAALLGAGMMSVSATAYGAESNDAYVGVDSSYSDRVEECTTAYHEAQDRLAELNTQMTELQGRIDELQQKLPEQKARASQSLRTLYKVNASSNGMLDLLLSADDFNEFLATIEYLDIIQSKNLEEIQRLVELDDTLAASQAALVAEQDEAKEQVEIAQKALDDAEAAREAARAAAVGKALEEEKARQAALEAARNREGQTFSTASGRQVVVEAPAEEVAKPITESTTSNATTQETPAPAETPVETPAEAPTEQTPAPTQTQTTTSTQTQNARDKFISVWAPRIDAFNEGWPLAGYGKVFAAAAYDYGVDPRWSPAIARLESSSGTYCFADHNAWGWGDSDWPDWETAIKSHVRGLAHGYGYTLTMAGAAMYCPPGDLWYTTVGTYMKEIWPTDQM